MTSALLPFEHEFLRAFFQEEIEQALRRHVKVRRDAERFERRSLRGATTGDQRDGRADFANEIELRFANFRRQKAQNPDAPRAIGEERFRLFEEGTRLALLHERQRDERERACSRNGSREGGAIAYACHRSLRDRKFDPVGGCERGFRCEWRERARLTKMRGDRGVHSAKDAACISEFFSERLCERRVLSDREELLREIACSDFRRDELGVRLARKRENSGARKDAMSADLHRLASIHRKDDVLDRFRRR